MTNKTAKVMANTPAEYVAPLCECICTEGRRFCEGSPSAGFGDIDIHDFNWD